MLEQVKLLLGITDNSKDDILSLLIEQATEEALSYTHQNSIDNLLTAIVRMVVYNFNRIGTEGVDSEGYSGVSFAYSSDYPDSIMRLLKKQKKIQTV